MSEIHPTFAFCPLPFAFCLKTKGFVFYPSDNRYSAIGTRNQAELHLSWLVKNYLENAELAHAIDAFHQAYLSSKPPQLLKSEEIH